MIAEEPGWSCNLGLGEAAQLFRQKPLGAPLSQECVLERRLIRVGGVSKQGGSAQGSYTIAAQACRPLPVPGGGEHGKAG